MNIGIIAASDDNLYASTLVVRLLAQSHPPVCILCARPGRLRRFVRYARVAGFRAAVGKTFRRYRPGGLPDGEARNDLERYARQHDLTGWDLRLSKLAKQHEIAFCRVDDVNSGPAVALAGKHELDLLINAAGTIFREPILKAARIGVLNAHMGLLPKFRGMNVLEWSIWAGQPLGVTVHFVDRGIDTGDILAFRPIPIEAEDTIATLRSRSYAVSVEAVAECVQALAAGRATRTPQRPEDGRQHFVMHPRLVRIMEQKLQRFYKRPAADTAKK